MYQEMKLFEILSRLDDELLDNLHEEIQDLLDAFRIGVEEYKASWKKFIDAATNLAELAEEWPVDSCDDENRADDDPLPFRNQNMGDELCARQPAGFLSGWYTTGFT